MSLRKAIFVDLSLDEHYFCVKTVLSIAIIVTSSTHVLGMSLAVVMLGKGGWITFEYFRCCSIQ